MTQERDALETLLKSNYKKAWDEWVLVLAQGIKEDAQKNGYKAPTVYELKNDKDNQDEFNKFYFAILEDVINEVHRI